MVVFCEYPDGFMKTVGWVLVVVPKAVKRDIGHLVLGRDTQDKSNMIQEPLYMVCTIKCSRIHQTVNRI
jgi:hypothetical protein